jgi:serine/threonine protein kinase
MSFEGIQIGHYRLIHLIGSGGMGEVYLAQDVRISRNVAIKVVRSEAAPYPQTGGMKDANRLFEREMKAITALDHPNILPLYDFGEEKTTHGILVYMVMPYRSEGSLVDWLRSQKDTGTLSSQEVIYFIHQASNALQHAHNHNLMHLDVKPSNFLIRQRDDSPNRPDLLLADFGIAKFNTATAIASQSIRGTPAFMAPEQWAGVPVPATDQYALAIMAYQLLTGRSPFIGNMQRVMYQHLQESPMPASMFNSRIPKTVDVVLLRALAKKPQDRFPSISAFAQAFEQAWHHEDFPVTPLPVTFAQEPLSAIESVSPEVAQSSPAIYETLKPPGPSPKKTNNHWLPIVIGLSVLLIAGAISGLIYASHGNSVQQRTGTPTPSFPTITATTLPFTVTPVVGSYPQLKSFYNGTASGYANGTITFTLKSEDQQGNIIMDTSFQLTDNPQKFAIYSCQGSITSNGSLHLTCSEVGNQSFLVDIHGSLLANGNMEGTWLATDSNDPNYQHFYNWNAS